MIPITGSPRWSARRRCWVARVTLPGGAREPCPMPGIHRDDIEGAKRQALLVTRRAREVGVVAALDVQESESLLELNRILARHGLKPLDKLADAVPRCRPSGHVHMPRKFHKTSAAPPPSIDCVYEMALACLDQVATCSPRYSGIESFTSRHPGVYFVHALGLGMIKIGHTRRPITERLHQIQVGCPVPARLVAIAPLGFGSWGGEEYFHCRHPDQRLHGEWFRCDDFLLSDIRSVRKVWCGLE